LALIAHGFVSNAQWWSDIQRPSNPEIWSTGQIRGLNSKAEPLQQGKILLQFWAMYSKRVANFVIDHALQMV
jgi:hypothetical protein